MQHRSDASGFPRPLDDLSERIRWTIGLERDRQCGGAATRAAPFKLPCGRIVGGTLDLLGQIHLARLEAGEETVARRDHDDLSALSKKSPAPFEDAIAGDAADDVVQAVEVLHINVVKTSMPAACSSVVSCHVRMTRPLHVSVRELVDEDQCRAASERFVEVEFRQREVLERDLGPRQESAVLQQRFRSLRHAFRARRPEHPSLVAKRARRAHIANVLPTPADAPNRCEAARGASAASRALTWASSWSGSGRSFSIRRREVAATRECSNRRIQHACGYLPLRRGEIQCEHVDARLAENSEKCGLRCWRTPTRARCRWARRGLLRREPTDTRRATLMCGSRPLAEAVTRSTGTVALLSGSASRNALIRSLTASASAGLRGPLVRAEDAAPLYGIGDVADGRPRNTLGRRTAVR